MPGFEIFGDEERKEIQDVMKTGVLFRYGFDQARQGHWKAKTFENELCKILNVNHALLCSSGTSALSIALASCGIGAGDEVILPPFTFVATIESVLFAGAIPIFSEINDSLCLDPKSLVSKITEKTRAVIIVHMCGSMAQIDEIRSICNDKNLILIEDSCQAIGASFQGKAIGTFGHIGCFSFDPVKTITCGEGGAIITNDPELYRKADAFADHGHDHIGNDRGKENHPFIGYNYRISELNAAVGVAQLRKLNLILDIQRNNKQMIKQALKEACPKISFRQVPDELGDSATFLSFFLPDEKQTREAAINLAKNGVDGCFYWYDNNWHYIRQWDHMKQMTSIAKLPLKYFSNCPDYNETFLPQSDNIIGRLISMQIKLAWTKEDIQHRIKQMKEVLL